MDIINRFINEVPLGKLVETISVLRPPLYEVEVFSIPVGEENIINYIKNIKFHFFEISMYDKLQPRTSSTSICIENNVVTKNIFNKNILNENVFIENKDIINEDVFIFNKDIINEVIYTYDLVSLLKKVDVKELKIAEIKTEDLEVTKEQKIKIKTKELNTKTKELNTKTEELNTKTEELKIKTEELKIKTEELKIKTKELNTKTKELNTKTEELKINSKKLGEVSVVLEQRCNQAQGLRERMAALSEDMVEQQKEIDEYNDVIKVCELQIDSNKEVLEGSQKEKEALDSAINKIKKSIEDSKRVVDNKRDILQNLENHNKNLDKERALLKEEIVNLGKRHSELSILQEKIAKLEDMQANITNYSTAWERFVRLQGEWRLCLNINQENIKTEKKIQLLTNGTDAKVYLDNLMKQEALLNEISYLRQKKEAAEEYLRANNTTVSELKLEGDKIIEEAKKVSKASDYKRKAAIWARRVSILKVMFDEEIEFLNKAGSYKPDTLLKDLENEYKLAKEELGSKKNWTTHKILKLSELLTRSRGFKMEGFNVYNALMKQNWTQCLEQKEQILNQQEIIKNQEKEILKNERILKGIKDIKNIEVELATLLKEKKSFVTSMSDIQSEIEQKKQVLKSLNHSIQNSSNILSSGITIELRTEHEASLKNSVENLKGSFINLQAKVDKYEAIITEKRKNLENLNNLLNV